MGCGRWWGLVASLVLACTAQAVEPSELLPAGQAFQVTAVHAAGDRAFVTFTIAPGYALYADRVQITSRPGALRFVHLPDGLVVHDTYLGDRIEWRRRAIAVIGLPAGAPVSQLQVHLQGCADVGVCFNPETRQVPVH